MNTQYRHFPVIPTFMGKRSLMSDTSQYFPEKMGKRLVVPRRNMYCITTVLHTTSRHVHVINYIHQIHDHIQAETVTLLGLIHKI